MTYLEYCGKREELLSLVREGRVEIGQIKKRKEEEVERRSAELREWDTHYFPRYWKEYHGVMDF